MNQDPRFRRRPILQLVPGRTHVAPGLLITPARPDYAPPIYRTEAVEKVGPSEAAISRNVEPDFGTLRRRIAVPGAGPGHFYSYTVAGQALRAGQRLRWGKHHRIRVALSNKGDVVLIRANGERHRFKSRQAAAEHLSNVMNRIVATGGFHTDIPMFLRGGDFGDTGFDLGARDSFGRYKEWHLADDLVVREYRKDEIRIMRTKGQVYPAGLLVPKGSAQHMRIMEMIAAEKKEARQERRQRAASIATELVESAAAGAVKGYRSKKKGKKPVVAEPDDTDAEPVEEPAPSSGLSSWALPVGLLVGLGLVVAVASSSRGAA